MQRERRLALLALEAVERGREARDAATSAPAPSSTLLARRGAQQQVERDRRLVREEPEQLHLAAA